MSDYPEHEKLKAVQVESQAIGEFIEEWCSQRGYALCQLVDSGKRTGFGAEVVMEYTPVANVVGLLAEFFGIDQDKIEAEKRAMLGAMRAQGAAR